MAVCSHQCPANMSDVQPSSTPVVNPNPAVNEAPVPTASVPHVSLAPVPPSGPLQRERRFWHSRSLLAKILILIGLGLILLFSAGLAYSLGRYNQIVVKPNPSPTTPGATASPTPDPLRPISILVMGYGGGGHQGGKLTDTMILAYIQPKLQTIHLFSIPRDVWVNLPIVDGSQPTHWKINAAYAIGSDDKNYRQKPTQYTGPAGGGELAKLAVTQALGLPVDHFAVVNFASFKKAIDVLGGVDVKVDNTFDDFQYPIDGMEQDPCGKTEEDIAAVVATMSADLAPTQFPCRYEHLHFDKGMTHMDGETALKYVRSRHSATDGSDFARSARQRNLIQAVKQKVLAANFIPKIIPFLTSLSTDFQTDIDFPTLQSLLDKQGEYSQYKIVAVPLTTENVLVASHSADGQFTLVSKTGTDNWQLVHDFVTQALTATQSATTSSQVSF